jgi:hypothetical protein
MRGVARYPRQKDGTMALERIIEISPAFDERDADPKKNYGIHGVEMRWVVKGEKGAIQFLLYTNWHLPHVQKELDARAFGDFPHLSCHPMPADIGYHALEPQYEGQDIIQDACPYLNGKPCYYDGSGLQANAVYQTLVAEGGDALWALLEKRYAAHFETETANAL